MSIPCPIKLLTMKLFSVESNQGKYKMLIGDVFAF